MRRGAPQKQFCKWGHDTFVLGRFGKKNRCLKCHQQYVQKYYAAHREQRQGYARRYNASHRDQRKQLSVAQRERKKEYDRRYYVTHREERRKYEASRLWKYTLQWLFGTYSKRKLPQEIIDVGVLYYKMKKEIRNKYAQTTHY